MIDSLICIKLGGSSITDKGSAETPNLAVMQRLAEEIQAARASHPGMGILLGHGSGSFGHVYAARYGIHQGLQAGDDWNGFALTADAARRLNRMVVETLLHNGVPAFSIQPSASLISHNRTIMRWNTDAVAAALRHGLVPVIHGDVAFDEGQGCAIISTETMFAYLALHTSLQPTRMVLVSDHAVYTGDPRTNPDAQLVPLITAANIDRVLNQAGGSHSIDVTGGMRSKIAMMWSLVEALPDLDIAILEVTPGGLREVLSNPETMQRTGDETSTLTEQGRYPVTWIRSR